MLISDEIKLFEDCRGKYSSGVGKVLQRIYHKYNPDQQKAVICCNMTKRKIAITKYYEWYDEVRTQSIHN